MSSQQINEKAILAHYEDELAKLEDERVKLEDARAKLDRKQVAIQKTIAGIRELLGLNTNGAASPSIINELVIPKNAFKGLERLDAAVKYLRLTKKPQITRDIADALVKGGWTTTSNDPADNVHSALKREARKPNPAVVKKNGKWELAEWRQQENGEEINVAEEVSSG